MTKMTTQPIEFYNSPTDGSQDFMESSDTSCPSHFEEKTASTSSQTVELTVSKLIGLCPNCGGQDGYFLFGCTYWFFCRRHAMTWPAGIIPTRARPFGRELGPPSSVDLVRGYRVVQSPGDCDADRRHRVDQGGRAIEGRLSDMASVRSRVTDRQMFREGMYVNVSDVAERAGLDATVFMARRLWEYSVHETAEPGTRDESRLFNVLTILKEHIAEDGKRAAQIFEVILPRSRSQLLLARLVACWYRVDELRINMPGVD